MSAPWRRSATSSIPRSSFRRLQASRRSPIRAMVDRHVRRTGDDYAQAFLSLLPHGQAWPRHTWSTLVEACEGLNNYWGYVDERAAILLETESDPRLTNELLSDWE